MSTPPALLVTATERAIDVLRRRVDALEDRIALMKPGPPVDTTFAPCGGQPGCQCRMCGDGVGHNAPRTTEDGADVLEDIAGANLALGEECVRLRGEKARLEIECDEQRAENGALAEDREREAKRADAASTAAREAGQRVAELEASNARMAAELAAARKMPDPPTKCGDCAAYIEGSNSRCRSRNTGANPGDAACLMYSKAAP